MRLAKSAVVGESMRPSSLLALYLAGPILILCLVWMPLGFHHLLWPTWASAEAREDALRTPDDATLQAVSETRSEIVERYADNPKATLELAKSLAAGVAKFGYFERTSISPDFAVQDLYSGLPSYQLLINSLAIPDVWMDAAEIGGDSNYLKMAARWLLAFARYERDVFVAEGFLRNDHAIASRPVVLARFWRLVRGTDLLSGTEKQEFLEFVRRTGRFLAKRSHFTFATNHGVMQNVALLQLAAAFPGFDEAKEWKQVAMHRLAAQLRFYISDEGVTLEHSAGYHRTGTGLLGSVLVLAKLNDERVPPEWNRKFERAVHFLKCLRRPDDTLPAFGDTDGSTRVTKADIQALAHLIPAGIVDRPCFAPGRSLLVNPISGNALFRAGSGDAPHGAFVWANFPGHGHKLADELSLIIWRDGIDWVTPSGYWPYGVWGRDLVETWAGSTAPHLVGESSRAKRTARLTATADTDALVFLDAQRTGPGLLRASRQLVSVAGEFWFVVDHVEGNEGPWQVTWTASPQSEMRIAADPLSFHIGTATGADVLLSFADKGKTGRFEMVKGRENPFAGWVAAGKQPVPAPAVVSTLGHAGWLAAFWRITGGASGALNDARISVAGPTEWVADVPTGRGSWRIARNGNEISVNGPDGRPVKMPLTMVDDATVADGQRRIAEAFNAARSEFGRFRELTVYRKKVSYAIGSAAGALLMLVAAVRLLAPWLGRSLLWTSLGAWLLLGVYIHFFYFG